MRHLKLFKITFETTEHHYGLAIVLAKDEEQARDLAFNESKTKTGRDVTAEEIDVEASVVYLDDGHCC